MFITNEVPENNEINEILNTLNTIDISLYDLLKKRMELTKYLPDSKYSAQDFVNKINHTISFITENRKYEKDLLLMLTNIISLTNLYKINLYIVDDSDKENKNITGQFLPTPDFFKYEIVSSHKTALNILTKDKKNLVLVPAVKTSKKSVWWLDLLNFDATNIGVIGKIPFTGDTVENEYYLLGQTKSLYGFNRSLLIINSSEPITFNWLKAFMHKLNISLFALIDSTASYDGSVFHLIEISKEIHEQSEILDLNESLNGINIRTVGSIGGYNLSLVDKDKIVPFTIK